MYGDFPIEFVFQCNASVLVYSQTHNESKVSLAALTYFPMCDFTAALVFEHTTPTLCCAHHQFTQSQKCSLKRCGSEWRLPCYKLGCFTVHMRFSCRNVVYLWEIKTWTCFLPPCLSTRAYRCIFGIAWVRVCISYSSHCCDRCLTGSHTEEKGMFWFIVQGNRVHHSGKAYWQEHEAVVVIASRVRKQSSGCYCQLTSCFIFSSDGFSHSY